MRVGRYQLEGLLGNFLLEKTERKNQHPKYWGCEKPRKVYIWGACDYNDLPNNQHSAGPTGHQEKEKILVSVICQE